MKQLSKKSVSHEVCVASYDLYAQEVRGLAASTREGTPQDDASLKPGLEIASAIPAGPAGNRGCAESLFDSSAVAAH